MAKHQVTHPVRLQEQIASSYFKKFKEHDPFQIVASIGRATESEMMFKLKLGPYRNDLAEGENEARADMAFINAMLAALCHTLIHAQTLSTFVSFTEAEEFIQLSNPLDKLRGEIWGAVFSSLSYLYAGEIEPRPRLQRLFNNICAASLHRVGIFLPTLLPTKWKQLI